MPEPEDPAEATARLESALERIAARALRTAPEPVAADPDTQELVDVASLAARLDAIIARLRLALSLQPSGISEGGEGERGETGECAS